MHVFSQEPTMARRWAQMLYLGMASLILIGIVIQGLFIGPSLFAATLWGRNERSFHLEAEQPWAGLFWDNFSPY